MQKKLKEMAINECKWSPENGDYCVIGRDIDINTKSGSTWCVESLLIKFWWSSKNLWQK